MTPEPPQPLAAVGPWALLLVAVASLALVCSGCHHTEVTCHGPVTVEAQVDATAHASACVDHAPNWDPRFGVHVPPPAPAVSYETRRAGYRDYRVYWEVWRLEDGKPTRILGYADHQGQARELIERDKGAAGKAACELTVE